VRTLNEGSYIDEVFGDVTCDPQCDVTVGTPVEVAGSPLESVGLMAFGMGAPGGGARADFMLHPHAPLIVTPTANQQVAVGFDFTWTLKKPAPAYTLQVASAAPDPQTNEFPSAALVLNETTTATSHRLTTSLPASVPLHARAGVLVGGRMRWSAPVAFTASHTTPSVSWTSPAAIVYGTALSGSQLNATADVPGTFAYSPAAGTKLSAGPGQTLSLTFTPADTARYAVVTSTVTLDVVRATPAITWPTPASIVAGTPLGTQQLAATADVPGTFTYTPASGTVLATGTHTLAASFAPADPANYTDASAAASIDVLAQPRIAVSATAVTVGDTVTASIANWPAHPWDWVGLFPVGGGAVQRVSYQFLNASTTAPTSAMPVSTLAFRMPSTAGTYELRLFRNNSYLLLATSPSIVVTAPSIAVHTRTPGIRSVTATFTNGPGNTLDWVGLYPIGGGTAQRVSYQFLNGLSTPPTVGLRQATLTFQLPPTAGDYELRFFRNNTMDLLARSVAFSVALPSITLSATSVASGQTVTATIANGPGSPHDWVGLFPVGGSSTQRISYQFLNGLRSAPESGLATATLVFDLPSTGGNFELRFFRDNSWTVLATSPGISVTVPTIAVSPTTGSVGGIVTATIANAPGNAQDWVGLYPVGGTAAQRISFQFLNGRTSAPLAGVTGAMLYFSAPTAAGAYELRLFRDNTMTLLATSPPITVTVPTITLSASVVEPNGTVTATIANGPGYALDWVGLFPVGGTASQRVSFQFLNGLTTPPETGLSAATLTLTLPSTPGSYEVRLFRNNSWTVLATSSALIVNVPSP
jgi:hypothetical protein